MVITLLYLACFTSKFKDEAADPDYFAFDEETGTITDFYPEGPQAKKEAGVYVYDKDENMWKLKNI